MFSKSGSEKKMLWIRNTAENFRNRNIIVLFSLFQQKKKIIGQEAS
jgi:hypothetical protein